MIHLAMENQIYAHMIYVQILALFVCDEQTEFLHKPMIMDSKRHLAMENRL